MASITKRGDNWRVQVRRAGAKPLTKTFSKKVLAETWAREMEAEVAAGKFVQEDPLLSALFQRYLDEILTLKPMQRSHQATMRTLRREVGDIRVSQVKPQWMLDFAKTKDVAPSTRGQLFSFIGTVLRTADTFWGVRPDWDEWRRGHAALVKLGLVARSTERTRRASADEIEAILDNMQSTLPMDELINFALGTTMRLSEIVRIQWADLDLERRTVIIRDRKHPSKKKGNHQTVPLLGDTMQIVNAQVKYKKEIFPYNPSSISAAFHRAVVRAGINDLRWHDLRHEGICQLFEQGYEIQEVAIVSGHASWNMLRRYTHLKPESLHRDTVA